jgi:hypothetical protein
MNSSNALAFLLLGLAMGLLPALTPAWFPHTGIDGSSARALWAETMGFAQALLGLGYLTRRQFLPWAARWLSATDYRGVVATGAWQPDALPSNLVAVDFSSAGAGPLEPAAFTAANPAGRQAA